MALDIKITGLETDRTLNGFICGNPGSGKTLFSSTFPNPFFASCEAGLLSLRARNKPYHEVKAASEMDEIIRAMRQPPAVREKSFGVPVDTLVVDTFDQFQRIVKRERLRQINKDILSMQDWGWMGELMRSYVAALRSLPLNVVVTCHFKKVVEEESGRSYLVPQLEGSIRDEVAGHFDIVGIIEAKQQTVVEGGQSVKKTTRVLRTVPDFQTDWLKDRSGVLPAEMELDLQTDYDKISDLIFADLAKLEEAKPEVEKIQAQVDAAAAVAEEVAEVTPEPTVSEEPAIEVKASTELASDVETISSAQFNELAGPFSLITDDDKRRAAKNSMVAEFGNLTLLPVSKLEEATAWVAAAVARNVPSVDEDPTADKVEEAEPTPESEPEVADEGEKREVVACTKPRCPEKDIDDEDVIELSRMQNNGKALCAKHLREMKK